MIRSSVGTIVVAAVAALSACGESGTTPTQPAATEPTAVEAPSAPDPNAPVTLTGTAGPDELVGGGGADHLTGGPGADKLDGASGFDYARYDTATAGIVASLADLAANEGDAAGDTYISMEGLVGSPFDDTLTGDKGVNDMTGLAGNDVMAGLGDNDSISGSEGDDTLDGGLGADMLVGGPGNDTFVFKAGEANGDTIEAFERAGAGAGDKILLIGYGAGATFTKAAGATWQIKSADGKTSEDIEIRSGGDAIDATDYKFSAQ